MGFQLRVGVWIMVLASMVLFLKISSGVQAEPLSMEIDKIEKPQRPRVFTSPEELKAYLAALARYYATVSRNRFGKRSLRTEPAPSLFGPNEVYDLLQTNGDK